MGWGSVIGGLVSIFASKKSSSGSASVNKIIPPQESKTPAVGVFRRNNQGGAAIPGASTAGAGGLLESDNLSDNSLLGK